MTLPLLLSLDLSNLPQPTDCRTYGGRGWRPGEFEKALISKEALNRVEAVGYPSATVSTLTYETVQAPPATVFLHALHSQIPTECLFTVVLPQKLHATRMLGNV